MARKSGKNERKAERWYALDALPRYATQYRSAAKICFIALCCLVALDWPVSVERCHDMLHKRCLQGGKITLTLEYAEYPLSKYAVEWQPDDTHLLRVGNPRLYQHPYQLPQLPLWGPTDVEWHVIIRCEPKAHRRRRVVQSFVVQLSLSFEKDGTEG